ncbi:Serine/threonine-protein kinase PrkC [bacterium HR11]|nr:Serine/threonine-protein kinase PrkC [bacterium HR11]
MGEIQRLGRYQVTGILGRGSMGVVYQGFDPLIEREVALKVIRIPPWMSEEEVQEYRERFFREAKAAGKLQHPNIVTIYDIGTDERTGIPFIVMELVRGETLKNRIQREGSLPWPMMVDVARQVAEALHFAHAHGIVHRDIKPSNIMLTESGLVKITDFGIAHMPASELTRTGQLLGSPSYMSPEQVIGERVTHRTDLFSLGVVLFEGLTGQKPFQGDTFSQITFKIVHEPPPDLRVLRPDLPEALYGLVERLLAKDPGGRFETAGAIAAYIRQHLSPASPEAAEALPIESLGEATLPEGVPASAPPIHGLETAQITADRWPRSLQALEFLVRWVLPLILLTVPFGWWSMSRRAPAPPGSRTLPGAVHPESRPTASPVLPTPRSVRPETPAVSPEACTVRFSIVHKYQFMDVRAQVDGTAVFEKRFYGRIRKFTVLKVVERSVASGTFPLPRGDHVLAFQMDGEGETKTYSQAVRCDESQEIRIRLENMRGTEVRALGVLEAEAPPR